MGHGLGKTDGETRRQGDRVNRHTKGGQARRNSNFNHKDHEGQKGLSRRLGDKEKRREIRYESKLLRNSKKKANNF